MDTTQTIFSSAKRFFSGTMLSRLTGLGREVVMAAAFGTSPSVAAFWMAFRFAHLLRRLFGEGALHVAFVPHFESLRKEDPKKAAHFFFQLSQGLTLFLLSLVVLVEIVLGALLYFGDLSTNNSEVVTLTMVLLPALIFICLSALNSSLLNCERSFFIPSIAPAALNFFWIGAVLYFWHLPHARAIERLAMVVVFAFAAQWFVTFPQVFRYLNSHLREGIPKQKSTSWMRLLRPFSLAIIGVTATQINSALDALFARAADAEGPAFLWYALRLQQLPLALIGVSLTGALLPPISRAIQSKDWEKYRQFLQFAIQKTLALMIPISFAFVAIGFSSVNLAFGRGEFSSQATLETTQCLWAYGAGLCPMTLVLIFASGFYAMQNYRLPTLLSILTVALNCGLNALFVFVLHWGALSVAIATSVAALFNALFLGIFLAKQHAFWNGELWRSLGKLTFCSSLALLATAAASTFLFKDHTTRRLAMQLATFFTEAAIFGSVLLGAAVLLKEKTLLGFLPKKTIT